MRIAILWTFRTDYLVSSARAAVSAGHRVLLILQSDHPDLPQDLLQDFDGMTILSEADPDVVDDELAMFMPDVVLFAGWHIPQYRRIARRYRGRTIRVMATDTQWRGNVKQRLGRIAFLMGRRAYFDWALVPGERQFRFVRKLGFPPSRIQMGSIPANSHRFTEMVEVDREPAFLFVGRLSPVKGLDSLFDAYARYRELVAEPWQLRVSGMGDLPIPLIEGVVSLGFLSPVEVATEMNRASCLVLPSRFEPWGVVLHEAAFAGLPLIATEECGAVPEFVVNGVNGLVVSVGDAQELAEAMGHISALDSLAWNALSAASSSLAQRSTVESWVAGVEWLVRRSVKLRTSPAGFAGIKVHK